MKISGELHGCRESEHVYLMTGAQLDELRLRIEELEDAPDAAAAAIRRRYGLPLYDAGLSEEHIEMHITAKMSEPLRELQFLSQDIEMQEARKVRGDE